MRLFLYWLEPGRASHAHKGHPHMLSPPTSKLVASCILFSGETKKLNALGDLWALCLESMTWRCLDSGRCENVTVQKPVARSRAVLWHVQETLYLHGGCNFGHSVPSDIWCFDLRAMAWRRVRTKGTGPSSHFGHVGFVWCGAAYVWGGTGQSSGDIVDSRLWR